MNLLKLPTKEIVKKSIELTDLLSELDGLIEKIHVLSDDVCDNYIAEASEISKNVPKLSSEIYDSLIREHQKVE